MSSSEPQSPALASTSSIFFHNVLGSPRCTASKQTHDNQARYQGPLLGHGRVPGMLICNHEGHSPSVPGEHDSVQYIQRAVVKSAFDIAHKTSTSRRDFKESTSPHEIRTTTG